MQRHRLDEISVGDITEAATLNRATFYDHYTDKFALFEALIAGEFHRLLEARNIIFDGTCPSALNAVVLAVCDYFTQAHTNTADCDRQSAFEPLFAAAVVAAVQRVLLPGMRKQPGLAESPEMIAGATSWAIYGAVKEWLRAKRREPAEKIAKRIVALIAPLSLPA